MVGATRALGASGVTLAWPNDVVLDDGGGHYRKLAGVLSEAVVGADGTAVVVGCGCNVDLPEGFEVPAGNVPVSLSELVDGIPDRAELLVGYLERLATTVGQLEAAGPSALLGEVRAAMWTLGRDVEVEGVRGRAVGLDDAGRLVLETADGAQVVAAGDVR
jgi:BirA family biotin operon repressor/biotin-[acetyl-CoA-carboxylase] ligase